MEIEVRHGDIEQAIKVLSRQAMKDGIPKEVRRRRGIREAQRQKEAEAARGSEPETEGGEEEGTLLRGASLQASLSARILSV